MAEPSTSRPPESSDSCCPKIRAWLQLMRIANLPTAISNVLAGALISKHLWRDVPLGHLMFASAMMYCGGMILNDAFDAKQDATSKPERPIPSKAISRKSAFGFGLGMLVLGMFAILIAPYSVVRGGLSGGRDPNGFAILTIAISLPIAILLYNGPLKKTWLAPPMMGLCRTLNILLGGAGGFIFIWYGLQFRYNPRLLWYAAAIGIYVTGITLLARRESEASVSRRHVGLSSVVVIAGLVAVALTGWMPSHSGSQFVAYAEVQHAFLVMVALIAVPIVRRLIVAVRNAKPSNVGAAIVTSLSSLIFLDAAVCFLVRPDQLIYAGSVALLIIPVMILRRFSAQT